MRLPLVLPLLVIFIDIFVDTYIYLVLKRRFKNRMPSNIQLWSSIVLLATLITAISLPRRSGSDGMLLTVMWLLYVYITVYLPKYLFVIIDLVAKIPELIHRKRIRTISSAGALISIGFFITLWWAALINRNDIQITNIDIEIQGLPESFDGYRIAQFSDIHVGTFGKDTTFVSHIVERINSQKPDVIVFTGDIVNSRSEELIPYVSTLSKLSAPDSVFSILGNHDYGDYTKWQSPEAKTRDLQNIKDMQRAMGWNLLLNETKMLRRDNDSIALIGVENIGDHPFPIYGSLTKAYPELSDSVTKILLTHNPAHWTDSISSRSDINVALSLSGHTHAMQIEILGWSPAKYRYPTWKGLYTDYNDEHKLYVNIGCGTVGFPARLGATPEVTIITLRKAKSTQQAL